MRKDEESAIASWEKLREEILACRRCPRLAAWREETARNPPRRFAGQAYHARPVPAFGDPAARMLIVGLAPAAHGANRTGRLFTGDRSGDWLYRALYRAGFANQPDSISADDGLRLKGACVTAACRCAPPENKPEKGEFAACASFLDRELELLWPYLRVIVCLGALALDAALGALRRHGAAIPRPAPKFKHGAMADLGADSPKLLMSYHPSQQNTFTGKLTEGMFDEVWSKARELAGREAEGGRAGKRRLG